MVLSTIAVAVTTFCLWVLSAARPFMLAGIGILSVASIFGLSWLTYLLWFGPGEGKAWEMLWSLTATAVVALACIRSVQVRLVLARDHSRELLFGPLRDKSFSVRMAAALGLPSSLWDSAALRSKELWAFLAARPIVYLGGAALIHSKLALGILLVAGGHAVFVAGKRVAARAIWRPAAIDDGRPPILFLRSFDDDQFTFQRPPWQLHLRWLDLWSFRRNVDEAMVDEIAQFGPVVALGRVGEMRAPFGAARHYSSQEDWQLTVKTTALRARAIVLVAGVSPSLEWEIDLLRRENLLGRTVLLFHPDRTRDATNRRAVNWLLGTNAVSSELEPCRGTEWVALLADEHGPRMLCSERLTAAAYVVALRTHFLGMDAVVRCFNDKPSARSAVRPPRYSKTSI